MRKMKDSGIDIVGEMPSEWDLIRLRYLVKITTGDSDTQDADPDGIYPFYVRSPIVERSSSYTFNGEGILMAGDGAGAGRIFHHAFGKYAVHQRVYRLFDFKINSNFLFYFISNLFPSVMDKGSAQSTVPSVRLPMLQNFEVCQPPLPEQKKIADFLDGKCADIDQIRADIEKQIEILTDYKKSVITEAVTKGLDPRAKMKDSGIEWIGKIPEHWEIKPIKTIAKIYNGREVEEELDENDFDAIRVFGSGGVFKFTNKSLYEGEAVLFGRKGTIGKPMIVSGAFWTVDTMYYSVCKQGNDNRFLYYILTVFPWEPYTTQTALPSVVATEIFRNSIGVPSFPEQKKITDFLDEKCTEIETAIAEKQKQLETLEEYKKSLIFEYVTGKKEVPT